MIRFELELAKPEDVETIRNNFTLKFGEVDVFVRCLEITNLGGNRVKISGQVVDRPN